MILENEDNEDSQEESIYSVEEFDEDNQLIEINEKDDEDEIEVTPSLRNLRDIANTFGLKVTSVEGIIVRLNNGKQFIYKQSSADKPIGKPSYDWLEDDNKNIIMNPIEIRKLKIPRNYTIFCENKRYKIEEDVLLDSDKNIE